MVDVHASRADERGAVLRNVCIAIDLEIGRESGSIHRFAAILGEEVLRFSKSELWSGFRLLEDLSQRASYVVGHNIIAFDLPHLRATDPDLKLLQLPVIDTLRLSPLAFPRNPYHRLVKHYKDGGLLRFSANDPALDTRISLQLLSDEEEALQKLAAENESLFTAFRWLVSRGESDSGFASFFDSLTNAPRPDDVEGAKSIAACLHGRSCSTAAHRITHLPATSSWPIAYALAWISVAGGNSVVPPWVRHEFPETQALIRHLRDNGCGKADCEWCLEHHNPRRVLNRWFGFDAFRPEPPCEDGTPMQEAIVAAAMAGRHTLGILPTGTGKSVCYQVPALSRYENTGALTIVISPLVALMEDQVRNLHARGISSSAALNGLLSMPERSDVLERVRLGDIAILLVSPEQLRNQTFRKTVQQREIGAWVLDEAHCLSKWGQDFRTDYRYVGRFIKESAGSLGIPPVLCLTATAKPDVVAEIRGYFVDVLGVELEVFNGGAKRDNLDFLVVETTSTQKLNDVHELLERYLPPEETGGAIVYCATRKNTEIVASHLNRLGWSAAFFHAGLNPESKKSTQKLFINGDIRIIAATNAFGMGIDKPDVRIVIHADIPGSLENYLQEAGRAGRDLLDARCILLYCEQDMEQQFGLSAFSRLPLHEIQAVLRALRRLAGKRRPPDESVEVVATPGEILARDEEAEFNRDSNTDDTRVRTAISWLEQAEFVSREDNRYEVFPSTLKTPTLEEADKRLARFPMPYQGQLRAIVHLLLQSDPTEGVTTDELMGVSRLSHSGVSRAMRDLEAAGIVTDDSILTASVHVGVENSSKKRIEVVESMERALIEIMRENAPDLSKGESAPLHLRQVSQALKDRGHDTALPELVYHLLKSIAGDGRSDTQAVGSLRLRRIDKEVVYVTLEREWEALSRTAELRRTAGKLLLDHLVSTAPPGTRGVDLRAETTIGNLIASVEDDLVFSAQVKDMHSLVQRALLWLHEQEVLRLGRGLIVFRPAMAIQVGPGNAPFTKADYAELQDHYNEQIIQIHVMAEYARRGLEAAKEALQLALDYFSMERNEFIQRWFPQAAKNLSRQTTDASWTAIVEGVNRAQRSIVTDDREQTNVLVLAGPGSGKTRVLVHRIAYLVRVKRENPRGILALAYNRHAAVQIRQRLRDLIGDDTNGVTVMTCHALAIRLTGTSFTQSAGGDIDFAKLMADAIRLLKGDGLPPEEADDQRERLLSGFRWILVDEYQDIGPEQYELISALAGRTLSDPDRKLSLLAVGDDDQNIYSFAGASVEYIRRFQADYQAKPSYLVANYRSSANIIDAANRVIAPGMNRMKADHAIEIDDRRRASPAGGDWERHDSLSRGRVQVLAVSNAPTIQAEQVMLELRRLAQLDPEWEWSSVAVIARNWKLLDPVLSYCKAHEIPVQRADESVPQFWRLRETQTLLEWVSAREAGLIAHPELEEWLREQADGIWHDTLREAVADFGLECGYDPFPIEFFREWLAEWGRDARRRQRGLLLLTAHRAKGLEFEHVAVLDGGWHERERGEDPDAARRLFYVAMTRARKTLLLASCPGKNDLLGCLHGSSAVVFRYSPAVSIPTPGIDRLHLRLGPGDVDLGFAGRKPPDHLVHATISNLQTGDPLTLAEVDGRWTIQTKDGFAVGRMSSSFSIPYRYHCVEAQVQAVLRRFQGDGHEDYVHLNRCRTWEVVLPDLVLAPL